MYVSEYIESVEGLREERRKLKIENDLSEAILLDRLSLTTTVGHAQPQPPCEPGRNIVPAYDG